MSTGVRKRDLARRGAVCGRGAAPAASALLAIALAGLAAVAGCGRDQVEVAKQRLDSTVCAAGKTIKGIDVSYYQGDIDWAAVKSAGIQFAFVRVSDGTAHPDSLFAQNWSGARAAGVLRGAYQFFRPEVDPVAQANLLLSRMGTLNSDDLPPVLDVEVADGQSATKIVSQIHKWADTVEQATGRAPEIYAGKYSWQDYVGSSADFIDLPLWVAQWGPSCPDLPNPWKQWKFWQTSNTGTIPGVGTGATDTDVFNGTRADLLSFAAASVAKCGDGVCNGGENSDTCPQDCPVCGTIPAGGGVIDDSDACFEGGGDPTYLRTATDAGYGGELRWTHTTALADAANFGIWHLYFSSAGNYDVQAYTAAAYAQSKKAIYLVTHNGTTDKVALDQSAADGWQDLGTFDFAAGGRQKIRVNDNTGEAETTKTQLVFDAVKLTPTSPPPDGGSGGDGGGSAPPLPDAGGGAGNAGSSMTGGCAVAVGAGGGDGSGGAGLLVALAAAFAIRRRRGAGRAHARRARG